MMASVRGNDFAMKRLKKMKGSAMKAEAKSPIPAGSRKPMMGSR